MDKRQVVKAAKATLDAQALAAMTLQERVALARSQSTSSAVLALLANDESGDVRVFVAGNRKTTPATLALLAQSPKSYVRWAVAHNPNTPPAAVALLEAPALPRERFAGGGALLDDSLLLRELRALQPPRKGKG
jgi:hypothetical protein